MKMRGSSLHDFEFIVSPNDCYLEYDDLERKQNVFMPLEMFFGKNYSDFTIKDQIKTNDLIISHNEKTKRDPIPQMVNGSIFSNFLQYNEYTTEIYREMGQNYYIYPFLTQDFNFTSFMMRCLNQGAKGSFKVILEHINEINTKNFNYYIEYDFMVLID